MNFRIGVDIGGTSTVIGLVDENGQIIRKESIPTIDKTVFADYINDIATSIRNICSNNEKLLGIGVGAPNGNVYKGTIEFAPNLPWNGILPIKDLLSKAFDLPVFITNDANAAAMGEKLFGGAKKMNDFIVITLGTGVGSGIYVNGNIVYGHDGFAGEIGHVITIPNGRKCACGRLGCIEAYASAHGIIATFIELKKQYPNADYQGVKDENLNTKVIYDMACKGNECAIKTFDETARLLGLTIANSIAYTSPEAVFIFGGIANAGEFLFEPLRSYVDEYVLPIYKGSFTILRSALKESNTAILGAAALVN